MRAFILIAMIVLASGASLGLIGWGCWMIYPPAGPIAIGALMWLELVLWGLTSARRVTVQAEPPPGEGSGKQ